MILNEAQQLQLDKFLELHMNLALQVDSPKEKREILLRLMQLINPEEKYNIPKRQEKDFYLLIKSYFKNPGPIFSIEETNPEDKKILQILFRLSSLKYINDFFKKNKKNSALPKKLTKKWIIASCKILKNKFSSLKNHIQNLFEAELKTIENIPKSIIFKRNLSLLPIISATILLTSTVVASGYTAISEALIFGSIGFFDVSLFASGFLCFHYQALIPDDPTANIKASPISKYIETESFNKISIDDLKKLTEDYIQALDLKINNEFKIFDELFKETYTNILTKMSDVPVSDLTTIEMENAEIPCHPIKQEPINLFHRNVKSLHIDDDENAKLSGEVHLTVMLP